MHMDSTVAMAAPSIPSRKPKMKMGSSRILAMTPVRMITIDCLEEPAARMLLQKVKFRLVSKLPGIRMVRYLRA